jgi:regulator of sigma E protease
MTGLVSFVLVFGLLIFMHELGHFLAAKLTGVQVKEFGFGYPPRLVKLGTWRGTAITLNWLPFGGFVNLSENDPTVAGGLASRGRGVRALVFASGALMNVLLAIILFSITFMAGTLTSAPELKGAGIYSVSPQSPAEKAGLLPGDNIVSIAGQAIQGAADASQLIKANLGHPIDIVVQRNGQVIPPFSVVPRVSPPPNEGALGVALDVPLVKQSYPLWQAVPMACSAAYHAVASIFGYLREAVRGHTAMQLSGPVGIYGLTREVAKSGLVRLLEFTGFLSINLAFFQLFPLPALDGGHLIFVLLEWVRGGRKIAPEKEGMVHAVGMALLIGLMLVVTFFDVQRLFG